MKQDGNRIEFTLAEVPELLRQVSVQINDVLGKDEPKLGALEADKEIARVVMEVFFDKGEGSPRAIACILAAAAAILDDRVKTSTKALLDDMIDGLKFDIKDEFLK